MPSTETRRRARYVLLVLSLLAVTLITLDARGIGVFDGMRNVASDVVAPVGSAFAWVTTPVRNAWGGMTDYDHLERENARLRGRVAALEGDAMKGANAIEQLKRLRRQMNLGFAESIPSQIARVVSGPSSNFDTFRLEIDKGTDQGVAVGNPVVVRDGLVGRIERASRTRSVVQLLTDPDFRLGVRLASTQTLGVGHGGGDSDHFIVQKIQTGVPVDRGEVVLTSGLENSVMPPDIPIGTVGKVTVDEIPGLRLLLVDYGAKFSELDVVQVLKWQPPR
ncbi:MAG: rod shape-determining protein MreC [Actinobacteria bacterium]|nr:rod shape-determining protein MreC [Actinomycetota bacterium]